MEEFIAEFPDVPYLLGDDPFELLKSMMNKERRIRTAFTRMLELTKDQRELNGTVKMKNLRPYDQRKEFSLKDPLLKLPDNIPFELYCLWRTYQVPEYDGASINQFFHTFMFSFEFDLTLFQRHVNLNEIQYVLFSPLSTSSARLFLQQVIG